MPVRKPRKGESQDDFMAACMHELAASETARPQDQMIAICMSTWREGSGDKSGDFTAWRERIKQILAKAAPSPTKGETYHSFMARCKKESDEHSCETKWNEFARAGEKDPGKWDPSNKAAGKDEPYGDVEYADPGFQKDGKKRYPLNDEEHIRAAWDYIHKEENRTPYTAEQLSHIEGKIIAAWKSKIDPAGPPEAKDIDARIQSIIDSCVRAEIESSGKQYPEPDEDESRDDFLDRCTDEMTDDEDVDDDYAMQICQVQWQDNQPYAASAKPKPEKFPVFHKTHADTVQGFEFIMSDDSPDRMGDIIASDGWDITNFKRNPVCLFNHNPNAPIGKWTNIRVDNNALKGHLEFAPKGISPRIDEIRALVEHGILQAVSVGFRPIEQKPRKQGSQMEQMFGGSHFMKQELIETSLVSVPANPNALAIAKSLNVSPETIGLVFRQAGQSEDKMIRRDFHAKHGETSRSASRRSPTMSLAQRISDLQEYIGNKKSELEAHIANGDDSNVKDADIEKTTLLNQQIGQATKQLTALVEAEKNIAATVAKDEKGNGHDVRRALVSSTAFDQRGSIAAPIVLKHSKKDWEPLDYLVHAGVATAFAKQWNVTAEAARIKIYGDDEAHKVVHEWTMRAASAPAITTVTGWAAELVQQVYADLMGLLFPKSVFPRLSAKGLTLAFGRAGRIILPTRSRTPAISGSFVGEGMAIPVRQGAFTTQTFVPKKMAVITVWTREMDEHSIPAIEGVLREAIRDDTAVALDSVLLDSNPATTIRPAGILNGIVSLTPAALGTAGTLPPLLADIKNLVGTLAQQTYGNIRSPAWLMNPVQAINASLASAQNTGIFPFKDEVGRGTLVNIPIIDSSTVPVGTLILIDAADFVTMQGDNMRFELSDQATLHMEDTTPLDLVSGSPGTVASPQRSLFQTDSMALRMIFPINWAIRRAGTICYIAGTTW